MNAAPKGPEIRLAHSGERLEIAGVHVRSWQVAYRGLVDDDFLDRLRPADRAPLYVLESSDPEAPETIVAVVDGSVRGFAAFGHSRDQDVGDAGEIFALYVDPPHWSKGIGRRLLEESCRRLRARGFEMAVLWVLLGNESAAGFYRAAGWRPDGAMRDEDPYGVVVTVTRYRRSLD